MTAVNVKKKIRSVMSAVIAASGVALLAATAPATAAEAQAIQPFKAAVPDKELAELRRRIEATRWPTKELVGSPGTELEFAL